jgi:integrase
MVRAWILPHIGAIPLQKLSARHLDALYKLLRARGGRGGTPLRGKSVRNTHALLSKAMDDALRRGHLLANPAAAVDPPARDDSVERVAWTQDEVRRFLQTSAGDRLHAVWRLALATGARRGELLGVTWDNVDERSVLIARQVLVRPSGGRGRVYVRTTTKTRRVRRVRFDEETAAALRKWKVEQDAERLAFGPPWKRDGGLGIQADWMVTEPDGGVIHPDTLLARWKKLVKAAGVTPIGLHGARHSYAEIALSAGVRLDVVSRQLGHASIATTANVYSHDSDEAASEAAELVARMLR